MIKKVNWEDNGEYLILIENYDPNKEEQKCLIIKEYGREQENQFWIEQLAKDTTFTLNSNFCELQPVSKEEEEYVVKAYNKAKFIQVEKVI
jgi:hypothetical protein